MLIRELQIEMFHVKLYSPKGKRKEKSSIIIIIIGGACGQFPHCW